MPECIYFLEISASLNRVVVLYNRCPELLAVALQKSSIQAGVFHENLSEVGMGANATRGGRGYIAF